jgi:AcrR family transcriptional regulator
MPSAASAEGRRKRLDAAARRHTIIVAAIPEFTTAGYDQTRVADVAARVGVTEPVVFQNFGTKAGLFAAVLDHVSEEGARYLALLGEQSRDVVELLSLLLESDLHERLHSPGGIGMLFLDAAGNGDAGIREAGLRANQRVTQAMAEVLRRGQAEGSVRADVDPETLAWLVLSQVHARQFRRTHGGHTSPALEQAMLDALLTALAPPIPTASRTAPRPGRRSSPRPPGPPPGTA